MKSITYTAIRANLASRMEQVCEDHDPVIITKANSKPVVMLSLEDYESLTETNYLLQNPKNAERLAESIDEIEAIIANKNKKK